MRRISGSLAAAIIAGGIVAAGPAYPQTIDPEALRAITETARQICGEFQREGSHEDMAVSGAAEAKVRGLLGKLVDVGVEGAGEINSEKYIGVLRDELGAEIKDTRRCNEKIWDDMKALVLTPVPGGSDGGSRDNTTSTPDGGGQSGLDETGRQQPLTGIGASPDISGGWAFISACPNPAGFGQITAQGEIWLDPLGGHAYSGTIVTELGAFGEIAAQVSGQDFRSDILWIDGSISAAYGSVSPDGSNWMVQDSDGCIAEVTRGFALMQ